MAKHAVLVVDIQESTIERVRTVLANDGYEVAATASSREAVDLARRVGAELLVINPTMPIFSGVEAARQIAQSTHCKVLFLTELAKDPDFREMLRGLKQQGCECSAIEVTFDRTALLAHVRREIGPAGSDARPAPQAQATVQKAPIADYEPLLSMVGAHLYERNAFRVTGLPVDASLRDISRKAERLEMTAKLEGSIAAGPFFATAPSPEEVRAALQCLKAPDQRLLHEFFWFWPVSDPGTADPALVALDQGDTATAEELWHASAVGQRELRTVSGNLDSLCSDPEREILLARKEQLERITATSVHNLAVLYHIRALGLGNGELRETVPTEQTRQRVGRFLSNIGKSCTINTCFGKFSQIVFAPSTIHASTSARPNSYGLHCRWHSC